MERIIPVHKDADILPQYRNTPVELLLQYQNLGKKLVPCEQAQILIGMCMDNRKHLRIPDNFAFIIRSGGGNLRYSEFKVSYAISVGNVGSIALIAHNNCGMKNLYSRKEMFIDGLMNRAGWTRETAEDHFTHFSPMFEIGDEIEFVVQEAKRLRNRYPKIFVAPLFYKIEDGNLYQVLE